MAMKENDISRGTVVDTNRTYRRVGNLRNAHIRFGGYVVRLKFQA